jgi:hypothetical protein
MFLAFYDLPHLNNAILKYSAPWDLTRGRSRTTSIQIQIIIINTGAVIPVILKFIRLKY